MISAFDVLFKKSLPTAKSQRYFVVDLTPKICLIFLIEIYDPFGIYFCACCEVGVKKFFFPILLFDLTSVFEKIILSPLFSNIIFVINEVTVFV